MIVMQVHGKSFIMTSPSQTGSTQRSFTPDSCGEIFMKSSQTTDCYCHSGVPALCLTHNVIHLFTALYALWSPWWLLLCCEALEFLTLSLAWLAAILYLRHLVPRHLTATGQGLAVSAHFCIGRSIGSIIASALSSSESGKYRKHLKSLHRFLLSNI
jgi:hypothetical protein